MRNLLLLLACGATLVAAVDAVGQRPVPRPTRTTSVHWDRVPLGDALHRLAAEIGEPILIDRRVDPNQRISLRVSNAETDELVKQAAAAASLGMSRVGDLIYTGPPEVADQLRTRAAVRQDEITQLPAELRGPLERRRPLEWPRLAEPRALVTKLVEERGWRLAGSERIPHDLWVAGSLRPSTLAEQLSVLLAGFELTFSIAPESRTIELKPLTGRATLVRRYRLHKSLSGGQIEQLLPAARVRTTGDVSVVEATLEDHERLAAWLHGQRASTPATSPPRQGKQVYTLRVQEQPVGAVLRQLGERLGWTIEMDEAAIEAAGLSLDQRVSFDVKNSDANELLDTLLRPAGLTHRRVENRVVVFPIGLRHE